MRAQGKPTGFERLTSPKKSTADLQQLRNRRRRAQSAPRSLYHTPGRRGSAGSNTSGTSFATVLPEARMHASVPSVGGSTHWS